MKGFIEVTNTNGGNKVLVSITKIIVVDYDEDNVYIVCDCKLKRKRVERLAVFVQESYEEVKRLIEEATK